jgi:hypothetical protein
MHVGAYGFNLILTTKLDLTTTQNLTVFLKRPDGIVLTKELDVAAFTAPITPDKPWRVAVPVADGDLSVAGVYQVQLSDVTSGRKIPSAVGSFNVLSNLQEQ